MGVVFDNVDLKYDACWWKGGTGTMTVPIEVPGDLVALGFSAQFRARSEKDRIRVAASTDDGQTWREVAMIAGPTQGRTEHIDVAKWPPGRARPSPVRDDRATTQSACRTSASTPTTAIRWPRRRSPLPRRPPLEGRRTRTDAHETIPPAGQVHDPAGADPEMVSVTYEMAASR